MSCFLVPMQSGFKGNWLFSCKFICVSTKVQPLKSGIHHICVDKYHVSKLNYEIPQRSNQNKQRLLNEESELRRTPG